MLGVYYIANFLHQRTEPPFKDNGFSFGHVLPLFVGRKATQWFKGRQIYTPSIGQSIEDKPRAQSSFQTPKLRADIQTTTTTTTTEACGHTCHFSFLRCHSGGWCSILNVVVLHQICYEVSTQEGSLEWKKQIVTKGFWGGQIWVWILSDWVTMSTRWNWAP